MATATKGEAKTAFHFYRQTQLSTLHGKNIPVWEQRQIIISRWKELPEAEQAPFNKLADADREAYNIVRQAKLKKLKDKLKDDFEKECQNGGGVSKFTRC